MKTTIALVIVLLVFAILAASSYAQSQREQLSQMVEELQKTPNDNALRERIIKLGAELKPAPAVSDEAIRYEGRAQFAFTNAKSADDYLAAAKEYEKAVAAAPWVQNYYSDLCKLYEMAGKFEDAKRQCGFYLIGVSDPAQMTDVKRRIAGLEYGIDKANSQARETEKAAQAAKEKAEETLIVPGERIGRIRLGMPMSQVERILGKPERSNQFNDGSGTYRYKSLGIVHDEQMNVYRVQAFSAEYKTRAGVAVGARFDDAQREWGPPLKQRNVEQDLGQACFVRGTELETNLTSGRIISIEVAYRCQRWAQ